MTKKLLVFTLAVMLLGVFGLTGCDNINLAEYKVAGKGLIDAHAATKTQGDYTEGGWAAILKAVADGKAEVDDAEDKVGVDTSILTAKNEINAVFTKEQEMGSFVLTIAVEKTTFQRNEDFRVSVVLKNISGEGQEIGFNYGFIAHIPGYIDFFDPDNPSGEMPELHSVFLDDGDLLSNIGYWGEMEQEGIFVTNRLVSGTHEMQFHFLLGLDGESVRIWSNKIIIKIQ